METAQKEDGRSIVADQPNDLENVCGGPADPVHGEAYLLHPSVAFLGIFARRDHQQVGVSGDLPPPHPRSACPCMPPMARATSSEAKSRLATLSSVSNPNNLSNMP